TPATGLDTFTRAIDNLQVLAVIFEIMRPSPESGRNFQNRAGWQEIANAGKNCAGPLRSGAAPRRGPFLARLFPIVFHLLGTARTITVKPSLKKWLGAESNRRHVDFQSTALPTELPSRKGRRSRVRVARGLSLKQKTSNAQPAWHGSHSPLRNSAAAGGDAARNLRGNSTALRKRCR